MAGWPLAAGRDEDETEEEALADYIDARAEHAVERDRMA